MIMSLYGFVKWVVDHNGAFLLEEFKKGDSDIFVDIPQETEKHQTCGCKLKRCIYGTKHMAKYYHDKVVEVTKDMKYKHSRADPCSFFK